MGRLFAFLLKLAGEHFYGEVCIRFDDGRVVGQVRLNSAFLETTLPEPDVADPVYQKVLAAMAKGV